MFFKRSCVSLTNSDHVLLKIASMQQAIYTYQVKINVPTFALMLLLLILDRKAGMMTNKCGVDAIVAIFVLMIEQVAAVRCVYILAYAVSSFFRIECWKTIDMCLLDGRWPSGQSCTWSESWLVLHIPHKLVYLRWLIMPSLMAFEQDISVKHPPTERPLSAHYALTLKHAVKSRSEREE